MTCRFELNGGLVWTESIARRCADYVREKVRMRARFCKSLTRSSSYSFCYSLPDVPKANQMEQMKETPFILRINAANQRFF